MGGQGRLPPFYHTKPFSCSVSYDNQGNKNHHRIPPPDPNPIPNTQACTTDGLFHASLRAFTAAFPQNHHHPLKPPTPHQPPPPHINSALARSTNSTTPTTTPPHPINIRAPVIAPSTLTVRGRVCLRLRRLRPPRLPPSRLPRMSAQCPQAAHQRREARGRHLVSHPRQTIVGVQNGALVLTVAKTNKKRHSQGETPG